VKTLQLLAAIEAWADCPGDECAVEIIDNGSCVVVRASVENACVDLQISHREGLSRKDTRHEAIVRAAYAIGFMTKADR
jgi:hypothetical protein